NATKFLPPHERRTGILPVSMFSARFMGPMREVSFRRNLAQRERAGVRMARNEISRLEPLNPITAPAFSLSSPNEDLSRLGSGERNPPKAEAREGRVRGSER